MDQMTDTKTLVDRLRSKAALTVDYNPSVVTLEAADRLETQSARITRLCGDIVMLQDDLKEAAARIESPELIADRERIDWLERQFGTWHQGSVISRIRDEWKCNSGFYSGSTLRDAIDNAIEAEVGKQPTP